MKINKKNKLILLTVLSFASEISCVFNPFRMQKLEDINAAIQDNNINDPNYYQNIANALHCKSKITEEISANYFIKLKTEKEKSKIINNQPNDDTTEKLIPNNKFQLGFKSNDDTTEKLIPNNKIQFQLNNKKYKQEDLTDSQSEQNDEFYDFSYKIENLKNNMQELKKNSEITKLQLTNFGKNLEENSNKLEKNLKEINQISNEINQISNEMNQISNEIKNYKPKEKLDLELYKKLKENDAKMIHNKCAGFDACSYLVVSGTKEYDELKNDIQESNDTTEEKFKKLQELLYLKVTNSIREDFLKQNLNETLYELYKNEAADNIEDKYKDDEDFKKLKQSMDENAMNIIYSHFTNHKRAINSLKE